MSETKYGQYFIRGPKPDETNVKKMQSIAYLDNDRIEGAFNFVFTYIRPEDTHKTHGPHKHPYAEVLGYFGTDPYNTLDLGGEMELSMGEEMEVHSFTQSTIIYLPANLLHGPLKYKKIKRPFIFIMMVPSTHLHEKSYKELVPEEERKEMVFFDR
jgi:hypothetical protein